MRLLFVPSIFLLISSFFHLRLIVQGRTISKPADRSLENNAVLRTQIGSRPPRCERKCSWCENCEAIQVPTNPIVKDGSRAKMSLSMAKTEYYRGEDSSNYKPICWKCKCGNYIFNPW